MHYDTLYPLFLNGNIGLLFATGGQQIEFYHEICNAFRITYSNPTTWKAHDIMNKLIFNQRHFYNNILPKKKLSVQLCNIIHKLFQSFETLSELMSLIHKHGGLYTLNTTTILNNVNNYIIKEMDFESSQPRRKIYSEYSMSKEINEITKQKNYHGIFNQIHVTKISQSLRIKSHYQIVRRILQLNYEVEPKLCQQLIDKQNYKDLCKSNWEFNWNLTNISLDLPETNFNHIYITRTTNTLTNIIQQLGHLIRENQIYNHQHHINYNLIPTTFTLLDDHKEFQKNKDQENKKLSQFVKHNSKLNANIFPSDIKKLTENDDTNIINNCKIFVNNCHSNN